MGGEPRIGVGCRTRHQGLELNRLGEEGRRAKARSISNTRSGSPITT